MVDVVVQHQAVLAEVGVVRAIEGPAVAEGLIQVFLIQPLLVAGSGQLPESLLLAGFQQIIQSQLLLAGQVPVEILHPGLAVGATGVLVTVQTQGQQVTAATLALDGGVQLPTLSGRHGHVRRIGQKRIHQPFDGAVMGAAALVLDQHAGQLGGDRIVQGRLVLKGDPFQLNPWAAVPLALLVGLFQGVKNAYQLTGIARYVVRLLAGGARLGIRGIAILSIVITTCQHCSRQQKQKSDAHGVAFSQSSEWGHLTAAGLPFATGNRTG